MEANAINKSVIEKKPCIKKLFVISVLMALTFVITLLLNACNYEKFYNTSFTESQNALMSQVDGQYSLDFEVSVPAGDLTGGIARSMVEKNCAPFVLLKMNKDTAVFSFVMLNNKMEGLRISTDGETWTEGKLGEGGGEAEVVYSAEISKANFSFFLTLETYVPKMSMTVDFDIRLDANSAVKI